MDLGIAYIDEAIVIVLAITSLLTLTLSIVLRFISFSAMSRGIYWSSVLLVLLIANISSVIEPAVIGYGKLKSFCRMDGGLSGMKLDPANAIHFDQPYRQGLYQLAIDRSFEWIEFNHEAGSFRRYPKGEKKYLVEPELLSRYSILFQYDSQVEEAAPSSIFRVSYKYLDRGTDSIVAEVNQYSLGRSWYGGSVVALPSLDCTDLFPMEEKFGLGNPNYFLDVFRY